MALDKCELSPELLLSVTLKFFYFLILSPDHLLLISAHVLCHSPPTCLQEHHFIQSDGGCSHGGSQDVCEDTHALHYGTIRLLSLLCPTGILVSLSIYGLHHNPKVWPNPEVRWTWEEEMGCSLHNNLSSCSCSEILVPW